MEGLVADIAVGTKRGSDELLSASYINGPAMTTGGATANGNDSKKFKSDYRTASGPSRVLHLRKLPCDVTESEVIALALPFGKVTNLLLLKGKGQAFLEMCSEEIAMAMVDYYSSVSLHIRSQPVYLQFSNYKELKTDNSAQQARANAALQAVSSVSGVVSLEAALGDAVLSVGASPVLHIIVENLFYPVSLDVLHQIFSKFGTVLKVITFTKNSQFQALLQYADAQHAQHAKLSLDGQNIYNACCTLRVDFSKLTSLNVKFNNDKSRDYTRPELPQGDGGSGAATAFEPAMVAAAFGPYGSGFPAAIGFPQAAGLSVPGMPLGLPAAAAAVRGVPLPSGLPASLSIPNCVLLASNLNSEVVTPQSLFILFGVYGDVHRVKILFNKKDNALIQMADSNQAQLAMSHLNGVRLYGKSLHVTLSRHQTVQLPREGHEDQGLTKDFSSSALHRFKKPGSKNFQNIYPPSSTLHLSNIPPAVSEEDLQRLFSEAGGEVRAFKFFPRDRKMALLQLGSVEEAISALIELHNHDLGDNHHLRVSFSKSSI